MISKQFQLLSIAKLPLFFERGELMTILHAAFEAISLFVKMTSESISEYTIIALSEGIV